MTKQLSSAMYCSRRCMLEDIDENHSKFCDTTIADELKEPVHGLMLRMLFRCAKMFKQSSDEFFKRAVGKKLYNVFDFDFSDCHNPMFCENMLLAALGGKNSNEEKLSEVGKISARFSDLLFHLEGTKFLSLVMVNEGDIPPCTCDCKHDHFVNNVGWSFHPLDHMFNASCHPNLQTVRFEDRCVSAWIVKYPVKAGQQLFKRYHPKNDWYTDIKSERQKIWDFYEFVCECEACINDWKIEEVRNHHTVYPYIPEPWVEPKEAKKRFEENCKYINKNYKREYPSGQLNVENMEHCNNHIFNFSRTASKRIFERCVS